MTPFSTLWVQGGSLMGSREFWNPCTLHLLLLVIKTLDGVQARSCSVLSAFW